MMVVLDTNHFRELVEEGPLGQLLLARIDEERADVFTCIVVAEESIRGFKEASRFLICLHLLASLNLLETK